MIKTLFRNLLTPDNMTPRPSLCQVHMRRLTRRGPGPVSQSRAVLHSPGPVYRRLDTSKAAAGNKHSVVFVLSQSADVYKLALDKASCKHGSGTKEIST